MPVQQLPAVRRRDNQRSAAHRIWALRALLAQAQNRPDDARLCRRTNAVG
ncbi:MAG: hypothetical protein IPG51_04695 [Chloroflexi bacterium]|nr:hypothetical protein [Chloroflexota bacterium]